MVSNKKKSNVKAAEPVTSVPVVSSGPSRKPIVDEGLKQKYKREIFVINFLTISLVMFFAVSGWSKLSPYGIPQMHNKMLIMFEKYSIILQIDKIGMDSTTLRVLFGIHEIFFAVGLLTDYTIPVACGLALILMTSIVANALLRDSIFIPGVVLSMNVCMSLLRLQVRRQIRQEFESKQN
mmetsp:Transcript_1010/g.1909  ORF Transcript_1010/g.1909 Transcript_1010/m.1909 type:complete len:180 (-) Transcript_1010:127-666(-)